MSKKIWNFLKNTAILAGITLFFSGIGLWFADRPDKTEIPVLRPGCDIQAGPCTQEINGCRVMLDIVPKPVQAMKDLVFRLVLTGREPDALPFIDLDMPDMPMGFNRVYMEKSGDGIYEGQGVIVKCPSGIPVWKADVIIPEIGETEFLFEVVY